MDKTWDDGLYNLLLLVGIIVLIVSLIISTESHSNHKNTISNAALRILDLKKIMDKE